MAARIPDVDGVRATPRSNRAIVSDQSGEILGDALERTGQTLFAVGAEQQERRDQFGEAKARSALLRADIEARSELERDQDFATHEQRYGERIRKARDAAVAMIRNPNDRALFSMRADEDIARGTAAIRGNARTIEVDRAMADLTTLLDTNRSAALTAKDEPTRAALIQSSIEAIAGARAQYGDRFTEVDATKTRQQWTHDYAEGYVAILPAEQRIALLTDAKSPVTQYLQPDERAKMLEQARAEDKELRLRSASMTAADGIMEAHGGDRGEALAAARKITDPEVRDAATNRINARFSEIAAIDAERNEEAFDAASTRIEQGASTADLDAATWLSILTQPQRQALQAREKQLQTGEEITTDLGLWYERQQEAVHSPATFAARNLMLDRPSLSDSDFKNLAGLQAAIETNDGSYDKLITGVRTRQQVVDGALREIGVDYGDGATAEQNERANQFRRLVDERVIDLQISTGHEATSEEVQRITDEIIVKGESPGSAFFGLIPWNTERRRFEVGEGEEFAVTDLAAVPADDRRQIEAALKRKGLAVTETAVLELFNLGMGAP